MCTRRSPAATRRRNRGVISTRLIPRRRCIAVNKRVGWVRSAGLLGALRLPTLRGEVLCYSVGALRLPTLRG
ncbi:hypothetical protein AUN08_09460 [Cronobacter sakazakii]|nr:hypothetical protein [Cronobacter sakazakii]